MLLSWKGSLKYVSILPCVIIFMMKLVIEAVSSASEGQLMFQLIVHGQLNFSSISEFLSELKIRPFRVTTGDSRDSQTGGFTIEIRGMEIICLLRPPAPLMWCFTGATSVLEEGSLPSQI